MPASRPSPPATLNTGYALYSSFRAFYLADSNADLHDLTGNYVDDVRVLSPPFSSAGALGGHFSSGGAPYPGLVVDPPWTGGQRIHTYPLVMGMVVTRDTAISPSAGEEALCGFVNSTNNGSSNDIFLVGMVGDGTHGTSGQFVVKGRNIAGSTVDFANGPAINIDDNASHAVVVRLTQPLGNALVDIWVDGTKATQSTWTDFQTFGTAFFDYFRTYLGAGSTISNAHDQAACWWWSTTDSGDTAFANWSADPWAALNGSGAATAILMTGPTSGPANHASSVFTIAANGSISGTPTVTLTDSSGLGVWAPTTVGLSASVTSATATYTPTSLGNRNLNCTNNASLSNPSNIVYNSTGVSITGTFVTSGTDSTPRANTAFNWWWYDSVAYPLTGVLPTDSGAWTTNGSGVFTLALGASSKTSGQVGTLAATTSDGTTTQSPPALSFLAPYAVT